MRVIAGSAKGKGLTSPPGNTRPLSSQAKEALFNILQHRVTDAYFLDLFAGSGSVGIEALSRGATLSIFVELEKKTVRVIQKNIEDCGVADRAEVYALDVLRAIKVLKKKGAKFDIIFLGAPYGNPNLELALQELASGSLLRERGIVVAEHRFKHQLANEFGVLSLKREARYGDTVLKFFQVSEIL